MPSMGLRAVTLAAGSTARSRASCRVSVQIRALVRRDGQTWNVCKTYEEVCSRHSSTINTTAGF